MKLIHFSCAFYLYALFYSSSAISYQCGSYSLHRSEGSIINTEESLANGAVALNSLPAESLRECETACCEHYKCNAAIFETTTKNLCYLFDCGRDAALCDFKPHSRYSVSIKIRRKQFKHNAGELRVRILTTPDPTSASTTTMRALSDVRRSRRRQQCPNPPDVQFPCHDANKFPSCVAVYDRCDGVPQCGDASDEDGCPSSSDNSGVRQGGPPPPPPSPPPPPPQQPDKSAAASLADRYRQSRAAVIGLGVALGVTLLAIVGLACRLRQLRSRFGAAGQGKLRSRMVDDEDYLINGMYL